MKTYFLAIWKRVTWFDSAIPVNFLNSLITIFLSKTTEDPWGHHIHLKRRWCKQRLPQEKNRELRSDHEKGDIGLKFTLNYL